GDAEAVADLDELAARHDDVASLGERREREQHRRGVVVDDERRLRSGQSADERGEMVLPRPALAALEVELEVGVAARCLVHPRESFGSERGPAEVRVQDDARRVQNAPEAGRARRRELLAQERREVTRLRAALYL